MIVTGFKLKNLGELDTENNAYPYYLGDAIKIQMPQGDTSKMLLAEEKGGKFISIKTPKNLLWFDREVIETEGTPKLNDVSMRYDIRTGETRIGVSDKYPTKDGVISLSGKDDTIIVSGNVQNNYTKFVRILGVGVTDDSKLNSAVYCEKVYGLYLKNNNSNVYSAYKGKKVMKSNSQATEIALSEFLTDSKVDVLEEGELFD